MEKGYASTTLDDVARHMGATKGRIYHYFASKSDLMHAVRKRAMSINFAVIRPSFESDLAPREKFQAMARAHALNMIDEQAYQKALFDNLHQHMTRGAQASRPPQLDEFITERRAFEDMFRTVMAEAKACGDFDFKTLSYALHTTIMTLNSSISWYTMRDDETAETRQAIADELTEMALKALGSYADFDTEGTL